MATDIKAIVNNLVGFYDFNDKNILSVGAGGGQLIEYGRRAKKVFAVDNDESAIERLKVSVSAKGLDHKFETIHDDFFNVNKKVDVVLFEFCLHEIPDANKALKHAKSLSDEVLVFDHWKESEWAFYVDETEKVEECWSTIEKHGLKRFEIYNTLQLFSDYDELYNKVSVMGETSISRIEKFKAINNIEIPMSYVIAEL